MIKHLPAVAAPMTLKTINTLFVRIDSTHIPTVNKIQGAEAQTTPMTWHATTARDLAAKNTWLTSGAGLIFT